MSTSAKRCSVAIRAAVPVGTPAFPLRILVRGDETLVHTFRSVKFLLMAPFLVAFLFVLNLMTWRGQWWVHWAALGLGMAWVFSLFRVLRAVALAGGVAALGAYLLNRQRR